MYDSSYYSLNRKLLDLGLYINEKMYNYQVKYAKRNFEYFLTLVHLQKRRFWWAQSSKNNQQLRNWLRAVPDQLKFLQGPRFMGIFDTKRNLGSWRPQTFAFSWWARQKQGCRWGFNNRIWVQRGLGEWNWLQLVRWGDEKTTRNLLGRRTRICFCWWHFEI